jgi:hypothetical protein
MSIIVFFVLFFIERVVLSEYFNLPLLLSKQFRPMHLLNISGEGRGWGYKL